MRVFIDESGSFTGFHAGSISVVGALPIPDDKLGPLKKKYAKIRARLPLEKGEVKGRLLNEWQIDEVVTLLARNEVLFEGTAIDLGMHTEQAVHDYKKQHGEEMLASAAVERLESVQSSLNALTPSMKLLHDPPLSCRNRERPITRFPANSLPVLCRRHRRPHRRRRKGWG